MDEKEFDENIIKKSLEKAEGYINLIKHLRTLELGTEWLYSRLQTRAETQLKIAESYENINSVRKEGKK